MDRLPALGSLRSIANAYDEDDISDEEEFAKSAKKRKLSTEEGLEGEKSEPKGEDSDYDIVVSDEEGNSSGAGSAKNAVVINQPRVTPVSRLVSYGGDEDEDDNAHKAKESEIPQAENEPSTSAALTIQGSEEATQIDMGEPSTSSASQPTSTTQELQNTEQQNQDKK
ncbi:Hypothetical predicted protein, partial [Paramuricea clavata]